MQCHSLKKKSSIKINLFDNLLQVYNISYIYIVRKEQKCRNILARVTDVSKSF